jgi:beta-lactam-binding protein with PASTA domain
VVDPTRLGVVADQDPDPGTRVDPANTEVTIFIGDATCDQGDGDG